MDDFSFGIGLGLAGAVADANAAADGWAARAYQLEANRDLWMHHAQQLESEVQQLESEVKELRHALAVEKSHAEGLLAVVKAFQFEHPDSPLLQEAGIFRSGEVAGRPKYKKQLVYESAFDAEARKHGYSKPASLRDN